MKTFEDLKKRLMKNKKFADIYKKREPLASFIDDMLLLRVKKGWSQKDLAERLGTKVPNISRIESGKQNISFATMQKISEALDGELLISLRGKDFVELSKEGKKILEKLAFLEKKEPAQIVEEALTAYYNNIQTLIS